MAEWILRQGWPFLAAMSLKSVFVLALAGVAALTLRRASAAARHLVWRLALIGLLLLPLFSFLPAVWQVPLASRTLLVPTDAPVVDMPPPSPPAENQTAPASPKLGMGGAATPTPPELGTGGRSLPTRLPWPVWVFGIWVFGVALTLTPTLIGLVGVGRLARQSVPVPEGNPLPELAARLAQDLGIVSLRVRLLLGDVGTPMTWGWLRPVVLLPLGADQWPEDRLRAVLLHELSHIARFDWPAQMASHGVCALYWWNPFVWLAARQARAESERACDDRVLLTGIAAPDYARHLLDVARSLTDAPLPAVLPMAQLSQMESRLRSILQPNRRMTMIKRKTLIVAALTTLAALAPLAALRPIAQTQADDIKPSLGAQLPTQDIVGKDASSVTVQLAGMTKGGPSSASDEPWWDASGHVLPKPLLTAASDTFGKPSQTLNRVIAFRVTSPGDVPVNLAFELANYVGSSSDGNWVGKEVDSHQVTESQLDSENSGYRVLNCGFLAGATQETFRVGIGEGPWSTAATCSNLPFGTSIVTSDMTCIFSPVTAIEDGSVVTISLGRKGEANDLRIVAIDNQGNERLPANIGDTSSNSLEQVQAHFALPAASIKAIRVETRPYQWVTFHNVALQPRS